MRRSQVRQVKRMLAGDKEEAAQWVQEHYPKIYRFLHHLTGDGETAKDMTQGAFLRAWQNLADFRGESSLATWLHRIAYHEYTHWLRSRRIHVPFDGLSPPRSHHEEPLEGLLLKQALAELTSEHREAFLLHHVQGFTVSEVAEILGVPGGTVKSRLFHARKELRKRLSNTAEEVCHEAV